LIFNSQELLELLICCTEPFDIRHTQFAEPNDEKLNYTHCANS
jgi:hypothetical protein